MTFQQVKEPLFSEIKLANIGAIKLFSYAYL